MSLTVWMRALLAVRASHGMGHGAHAVRRGSDGQGLTAVSATVSRTAVFAFWRPPTFGCGHHALEEGCTC